MLKTETNTQAMERRILRAAKAQDLHGEFRERGRPPYKLCASFEHGQWWLTCSGCGAQWSVQDAEGGRSVDGFDFEKITQADDESHRKA